MKPKLDPVKRYEELIKAGKSHKDALKTVAAEISPHPEQKEEKITKYGPKPFKPRQFSSSNWEVPPATDRKKR